MDLPKEEMDLPKKGDLVIIDMKEMVSGIKYNILVEMGNKNGIQQKKKQKKDTTK